jgi:hypothetical protein
MHRTIQLRPFLRRTESRGISSSKLLRLAAAICSVLTIPKPKVPDWLVLSFVRNCSSNGTGKTNRIVAAVVAREHQPTLAPLYISECRLVRVRLFVVVRLVFGTDNIRVVLSA